MEKDTTTQVQNSSIENKQEPKILTPQLIAITEKLKEATSVLSPTIEMLSKTSIQISTTLTTLKESTLMPDFVQAMNDFVQAMNERQDKIRDICEKIAEAEKIRNERRRSNFDNTKDVYCGPDKSFIKIAPNNYETFFEWYQKYIIFNEAYYDIPPYIILDNYDKSTTYTDPETGQKLMLIGVNSVSFEYYSDFLEHKHNAQRNGEEWTQEDERNRVKNIINIQQTQVKQIKTPNEEIKSHIERELSDEQAIDGFQNSSDIAVFIDAYSLHLQGEKFNMPISIQIRQGYTGKIARAVYQSYIGRINIPMIKDKPFMDLMRTLSCFRNKSNEQIQKDCQRPKD